MFILASLIHTCLCVSLWGVRKNSPGKQTRVICALSLCIICLTYISLWAFARAQQASIYIYPVRSITPIVLASIAVGLLDTSRFQARIRSLFLVQGVVGLLAVELISGQYVSLDLANRSSIFTVRPHHSVVNGIAYEVFVGLGWTVSLLISKSVLLQGHRQLLEVFLVVASFTAGASWFPFASANHIFLSIMLVAPYLLICIASNVGRLYQACVAKSLLFRVNSG